MVTYPSDWTESKLLDHVNLVQGLTYTPENVKSHGTLVLRSSNIQEGHLALEDNVYVDSIIPEDKMIQEGDILVCVRNGSSALIGKSCVLPVMSNTTFGAFMSVLRGDRTGYIAKVFESDIVQEQVRGRSNATINQITKKDFKSITVTMPDENEQKAIAGVLSCFDSYISDLVELIEKKKAIRDGALEDLVSGRIRLDGHTCSWKQVELGSIASYRKERDVQPRRLYISTENMNQMFSGIIPYEGNEPTGGTAFFPGDTLIANIRPYLKKIWCAEFAGTCSADVLVLAGNDRIVPKFLYYSLANDRFISYVMTGGVKGIKMPRGDKKYIMKYPLLIPSDIHEQKIISEMISAMDNEIMALEDERNKMIQIREGAMDDLLTGRVRLTV